MKWFIAIYIYIYVCKWNIGLISCYRSNLMSNVQWLVASFARLFAQCDGMNNNKMVHVMVWCNSCVKPPFEPMFTPYGVIRSTYYNDVLMSAMASQITMITSLTTVCSTVYSRRRSKKTSKLLVTGLCAGNSLVTGESPAQRASNGENVSSWWRHQASVDCITCTLPCLYPTCPIEHIPFFYTILWCFVVIASLVLGW